MTHPIRTRRAFLRRGLALAAIAPTVPNFLDRTMLALADPFDAPRTQRPTGKDSRILVVLQLSGGNDGLNTVIPFADDAYHRARPVIRLDAKSVIRLTDSIALHPSLTGFKKLYDDGLMSIIQGVGYPNPNRSHFRSMDIWQSAKPDTEVITTGWLGRYFDNTCKGDDPHVGVSLSERLPLAMQGQRVHPLSFEKPETYRYIGRDREHYLALNQTTQSAQGAAITPATQLDFLRRTAMNAQLSSDDILHMTRAHAPASAYPLGEFGAGLRTIAAMINGGLPTRVYYASLGSFDTHAAQRGTHDRLLQTLADAVAAFWADLAAQGNDDRVLVMTFSEFGRRVEQNASAGTDHGAAAPMFLFGRGVKPGIANAHPSLTDLDKGDLKHSIDFRSVYTAILEQWLTTPAAPIIGKGFDAPNVLKT
jgi:uncharacterized protein (DUF1501 family)